MKNINELLNERRAPKAYGTQGSILCNVDELDELLEVFDAGIKAINFDMNAEENRFHIIKQFYDSLKEDLTRVGDKLELQVRLCPDEKKEIDKI